MTTKTDAPIVAYKGFDTDMTCRGYQFEVGKTYEHVGPVEVCKSGFHACEYPLHVLRYYNPAKSIFAVVEQGGKIARHEEDPKIASSRLTVTAQIDLAGLTKAAIKYTMDRCTPAEGAASKAKNTAVTAAGNNQSCTASGDSGAATASGHYGAATASGDSGAATASGDSGAATASGHYGAATASGYYGAATVSGDSGAATASGYYGAATVSGHYGAATASGHYGAATASGHYGAATASGYYGAATVSGKNGKARGKAGCALFLVYRDEYWKIVHAKAAIVGENGIKADVYYMLNANGEFVEVA
jgi:hypothetical protein